jgi:pSer/pThr/pTyr-binding forkhead associated (FHA) protein
MNKGDEFALREGVNTIGRAPDCHITLFDKKSSRHHCQIVKKGRYLAVEDLHSSNGTLLNGKALQKRRSVKAGDRLRVGRTLLMFSDKAMGGIVDQVVTEAAAELGTGRDFNRLIDHASADALRSQLKHEAAAKPSAHGPGRLLEMLRRHGGKKRKKKS